MDYLSSHSYWHQGTGTEGPATFPSLQDDCHVDVAVIGAGITGLTAALHLKRAGKRVAVLEAGRVGAGTTGGTSGHLEIVPDQGWETLIRDFGEEAARHITMVRRQAIDQIEIWVRQLGIDCDFQRVAGLAFTEQADRAGRIRQEHDAALKLGVDVVMKPNAELPFKTAAAYSVRNQARFHSLRYLHALAREVHGGCAAIYENTRAQPPKDASPCVVEANGCRLHANSVLLATHSAYLGISQFDMRQGPYQSYVMAVRVADEVPDALYWDDAEPYHYIRRASSDEPRLLLVGGADHKTGQADTNEHTVQLVEYVSRRFKVDHIEHQWSAEFFEPADGLPMIGRVPMTERLYLATGFSGTGLTYGTAAGKILADMILTGSSPDNDVFSPARLKPLAAAKDLVSENLNAAIRFVGDRIRAEQVDSLQSFKNGEGRVVKYKGGTYAVYRDDYSQLHLLSPVCTHAGCIVQWNSAEHTWDCPCHGGRYSATGERIYGPPPADLDRKELS